VFFVDQDTVLRLDATTGVLTLVAGNGTYGFSGDNGPATNAQLNGPVGVTLDSAGDLYIADQGNNCIRKVSGGVITTVAGNGTLGFSGDNGPATNAQLNYPVGVAVDPAGNLYIADLENFRIRKVSNGVITTVAGNGTAGFSGDNGPATNAQLNYPAGVAVDPAGNLYIADLENFRIRKVSNGVITTVAGNGTGGFSGDNGPAVSARLDFGGVAVDPAGNVYIADSGTSRIRKVSNGVIATVAGNGTFGFSGDNGPATSAQLNGPSGVAVDSGGNLYIADVGNSRIRKVSNGVITTVAGGGMQSGDSGPATSAEMSGPAGVAVDSAGNLYIADTLDNRIR
jgi:sugar lactone lactonase YvrE